MSSQFAGRKKPIQKGRIDRRSIKPKGETWSKDSAFRRLNRLAAEGMAILRFLEYRRREKSPVDILVEEIFPDVFVKGEEEYNDISDAAEWILTLYALLPVKGISSYSPKHRGDLNCPSASWMEDVFYESVIYCQGLRRSVERLIGASAAESAAKSSSAKKAKRNKKKQTNSAPLCVSAISGRDR